MKKNSINRVIGFVIVGLVLLAAVIETGRSVYTWSQQAAKQPRYTIVIDPGHGGNDPGKIGINDVPEKDVNLAISLELKEILEQNDCRVVMTRQKDEALYQAGDTNKKVADLRARCQMINDSGADAVISIHQNSYPSSDVHGAQVFYPQGSEKSKQLADHIQSALIKGLDPNNHREAKANAEYYLFRDNPYPIVIVECGFLSNPEELRSLQDNNYQKKAVQCILDGIESYLADI